MIGAHAAGPVTAVEPPGNDHVVSSKLGHAHPAHRRQMIARVVAGHPQQLRRPGGAVGVNRRVGRVEHRQTVFVVGVPDQRGYGLTAGMPDTPVKTLVDAATVIAPQTVVNRSGHRRLFDGSGNLHAPFAGKIVVQNHVITAGRYAAAGRMASTKPEPVSRPSSRAPSDGAGGVPGAAPKTSS